MNKYAYVVLLILSALGILFSLLIAVENSSKSLQNFCSATSAGGCISVQSSVYGKTFNIDNYVFGITGFAILSLLTLLKLIHSKSKIIEYFIIAGSIIAGLVALRFLYIQAFILKTWCIYCIFIDIFSILLLCIGAYLLMKKRIWR